MDLDDELRKLFADDRLDVPVRSEADRVIVTGARRKRRRRAGVVFGGGMLSVAAMVAAGTAFGVGGDAAPRTSLADAAASSGLTTTTTPAPETTTTSDPPTSTIDPPAATTLPTPTRTVPRTTTTTFVPTPTKAVVPAKPLPFGPTAVGPLRLGMTIDQAMATGLVQADPGAGSGAGCVAYDWAGHPAGTQTYAMLFSPKYGLVRIGGRADAVTPEGIHDGSSEADVRAVYPYQAAPHYGSGEWVAPAPGNPNAHYWLILSGHVVSDVRLELAVQDCY